MGFLGIPDADKLTNLLTANAEATNRLADAINRLAAATEAANEQAAP